MNSYPNKYLCLHDDASGNLAKWTQQPVLFKRIMNYAMVIKDVSNLDKPGVIVNDVITSEQTTFSLANIFFLD
jgi:hypothetical protein